MMGHVMTPEDIEYWYSERAAILHFEGGLPIDEAEKYAKIELEEMKRRLAECHLKPTLQTTS